MTAEEDLISRLAYEVEHALDDGAERPAALRAADDYLWERGWFVPRRGALRKGEALDTSSSAVAH